MHIKQYIHQKDSESLKACIYTSVPALLLGLGHLVTDDLVPHLLLVSNLLCQVIPLEALQILDVPDVIVIIVAFLPAHFRVVQGSSYLLGGFFI